MEVRRGERRELALSLGGERVAERVAGRFDQDRCASSSLCEGSEFRSVSQRETKSDVSCLCDGSWSRVKNGWTLRRPPRMTSPSPDWQRDADLDSALFFSRARSGSISVGSPVDALSSSDAAAVPPPSPEHQQQPPHLFRHHSHHDASEEEEQEEEGDDVRSIGASTTAPAAHPSLAQTLMAGMNGGFVGHNTFDYSHLELWARDEKISLGVSPVVVPAASSRSPTVSPGAPLSTAPGSYEQHPQGQLIAGLPLDEPYSDTPTAAPLDGPPGVGAGPGHVRRRQRKLSQSNHLPGARRQGKLALFEGAGGGASPMPLPSSGPGPQVNHFHSRESLDKSNDLFSSRPPRPPIHTQPSLTDRPYRFSFYSNALPATIHARSLSELPADGQSFEDLFTGRGTAADVESLRHDTPGGSGSATPITNGIDISGGHGHGAAASLLSKAISGRNALPPGPAPAKPEDSESSTWWLDVLCPTDDEMKMLSKVASPLLSDPQPACPG